MIVPLLHSIAGMGSPIRGARIPANTGLHLPDPLCLVQLIS